MSTNFLLDQGGQPHVWTNLNVRSIKTKFLSVFNQPSGSVENFWLNNTTGDDLNDGLTQGAPVQTWNRLLEVAATNPGSVAILNIDGSGSFDPTNAVVPPIKGADCIWNFSPLDDTHDFVVVRGTRVNTVPLPQGAAVNAEPRNAFKQWTGLALGGVNYGIAGISYWIDPSNGSYGFEAVGSEDAADTVTICGANSNTHGGILHRLGGPQFDIQCNAAIVSNNPIQFESLRFAIPNLATAPNAAIRNRTIQAINVLGCELDTDRVNYFSGEWIAEGCCAFSAISDPTDSAFFNGAELQAARNCHLTDCRMVVRLPIRMTNNRHDDSKVRIENTLCESFNQLHVQSKDDAIELDSAILDINNLRIINSANNADYHCLDCERSTINASDVYLEKTSQNGRCINLESQSIAQLSAEQNYLNTNAGSVSSVIRVRNGSYLQLTPANDIGGVTRDFNIITAGDNHALSIDTFSECAILPYDTRDGAVANPAAISSAQGVGAIDVDFGSKLRLPPLLTQTGDLQLSSTDTAVSLRRMSSVIAQSTAYTNAGAGANVVKVGTLVASAAFTTGHEAGDLAQGAFEGCSSFAG